MDSHRYRTLPIASSLKIVVEEFSPGDSIEHVLLEEINSCWEGLQKGGVSVYDGWLFSVSEYSPSIIRGHFVPYRYFAAWQQNSTVREQIPLKPLSVSGITQTRDHILVGQRAATVLQYPGYFEFPPSGGVDLESQRDGIIDHEGLVTRELLEEAGIGPQHVKAVDLFTLIEDQEDGVLDLCYDIVVDDMALDVLHSDEYASLRLVLQQDFAEFFAEHRHFFVPASSFLWALRKKRAK